MNRRNFLRILGVSAAAATPIGAMGLKIVKARGVSVIEPAIGGFPSEPCPVGWNTDVILGTGKDFKIDAAFVNQYSANIEFLVQSKESRFIEMVDGKTKKMDKMIIDAVRGEKYPIAKSLDDHWANMATFGNSALKV